MKSFLFLTPLIVLSSFVAKADLDDCQKKLNSKRIEMKLISSNIVNINTTRTPEGGPYRRQELVCVDDRCEITKEQGFVSKFEPGHPDADEYGYVKYSDIDLMYEMSNLIQVTRDYEEIIAGCN